jgi:lysophospholipase L1-like esterase
MQQLQDHLRTRASATFALPPTAPVAPSVSWTGALNGSGTAVSSLPNGVIVEASSVLIGGPLRERYAASLAGNPTVDGFPCLTVRRPYVCKGNARSVGTLTVLHLKTDAAVFELAGVVPEGGHTVQTLIVDGQLVPPKVLSSARGLGGWNCGAIRIDFGTRATRDIWLETVMSPAYIKIDAGDTLFPVDDQAEPQLTVVGDSYLQTRSGTFGNGGAIALEIGARLGIGKVAIDAIGGTGYWNSNGDLGNLNDRLSGHAADQSAVYLIMAGINDYGDIVSPQQLVWPTRATYEAAVTGYLANLRAAAPDALLVVTPPFCPIPPMSDASYISHAGTNSSGVGDFLYRAALHKQAIEQVAGPWVYIDVLLGGGWLNSSGASGDITNLQWFTGGTPDPATTATFRPGNTRGGGGGFGGIAEVPVVSGGHYTQAPEVTASGGSGTGLLLAAQIDGSGAVTAIKVISQGSGYTSGGLPSITLDSTFELTAATLGTPVPTVGVNPDGQYPLPSFAPPGVPLSALNNIYTLLAADTTHPSPLGVEHLSRRLAENIYQAVMAL